MTFLIDKKIPDVEKALAGHNRVVLSAPPGAGKTIGVPLALRQSNWLQGKKIILLEPRRLAARRAAEFMSFILNEKVGETVGYRIRGDAVISARTRIEIVTEGILTRMLHANPDLPEAGLVIFDEFHERSLHADLGLAFALDAQKNLRDDLRILIMSATLDGVAIAALLGDAPVIRGEEKAFPVETRYAQLAIDKPMEMRIADVILQALKSAEGDILTFLPGMREIRRVEELLQNRLPEEALICPLHGDLPIHVQEAALAPAPQGRRKIILSTSIAETSLTIDGVRVVVDGGLVRSARFDPRRGMSGLVTLPISQATADQRRGRAGRQGPGLCYRLWRETEHAQLAAYPTPEIRVSDLAPLALDLARWGTPDGAGLLFLDPPPRALLTQAQQLLQRLDAMTADKKLTPHGQRMSDLSIHPRLAHMILTAKEKGDGPAACEVAAVLEERDFSSVNNTKNVDFIARIDALHSGRGVPSAIVKRIQIQKQRLMEIAQIKETLIKKLAFGALLALAYPDRIGRQKPERPGTYHLVNGSIASLPPGSPLMREAFLAIAELDADAISGRIFLAAPLHQADLQRIFAAELQSKEEVFWDHREGKVNARRISRLGEMIVEESAIVPDGEQTIIALMEGIRRRGLHVLPWDKESERLRDRIEWARKSLPHFDDYPDCSDAGLEADLESWLEPFLAGMKGLEHLHALDLLAVLAARLTPAQKRQLDRQVPPYLLVPSGSRIAISYPGQGSPILAVKLQELFGLTETPRIGDGRVPVTIHLLSPAARPLAITQDLRSFWQNTYPEIRKQLRARYPKHPWPEDPLRAEPTRKTLRRK